jgi:hypothetical protein
VTANYNSNRQNITLTAELESGDGLEAVEQKLYEVCKAYLAKCNSNGRNGNTQNGTKTEEKPIEVPQNGNGKNGKPWDNRNRPPEQLIKELNIKSPAHAGYLRADKKISYPEWKAVQEILCKQEIEGAVSFS